MMKDMTIAEFCDKHNACQDGRDWALQNCATMRAVWDRAKPEWLIWIATRQGVLSDRELRLFAVWSARQVQHLMTDPRSVAALDVAERHANGEATDDELQAARDAARAAELEAERAAELAAAMVATWAATWVATWAATWAAARVRGAAWGAARGAARDAAWDAAWDAQAFYLRENCTPNFGGAK